MTGRPATPGARPPASAAGRKIDLKLGYACERQCLFCVQGDLRRRHPLPVPAAELKAALRQGRKAADSLVFTGGEPTLYPYLPDLVRLARLLGYRRIQIQTNGRRFADPAYCRELLDAGATEFAPSIHGSFAELHDRLTDVPGAHARTLAGIRNLTALGCRVLTNTVMLAPNLDDLPRLAELLARSGVRHIQFAFVHITGEAARNREALVPRKSSAVPRILEAAAAAERLGARCFTEGIPPCVLAGRADLAAEPRMPVMTIYHADGTVCPDFTQERLDTQKAKGPRCAECRLDASCEGPWKEYPAMFGWEEFVPVP